MPAIKMAVACAPSKARLQLISRQYVFCLNIRPSLVSEAMQMDALFGKKPYRPRTTAI